jgi:hypothetical protein
MANTVKQQIQALVDLETKGWYTKNPDRFLSIIHPYMAYRSRFQLPFRPCSSPWRKASTLIPNCRVR